MQIKIQCNCGQKYAFDAEPVHGQMPFAVTCPACGVDGTGQANSIIQQSLDTQQPPVATIQPPLVEAAPASGGLRINRPQHQPAAPQYEQPPPAQFAPVYHAPRPSSGKSKAKVIISTVITAILVIYGCYAIFKKWSNRINLITEVADAVKSLDSSGSAAPDSTLPDDDGTMLLVKHTDEKAVAEACASFWNEKFKQKMIVTLDTNIDEPDEESLYVVLPAHKNCVELEGMMFWEEKDVATLTAMSEYLARKLQTTSVCALMGDDAETGVFAIYENGTRKFYCYRNYKIQNGDLEEIVKLEGEDWAKGLGFKPDPENGWKGFTMYDANKLTEHIGLNLSDRPIPTFCLLLQTPGAKP